MSVEQRKAHHVESLYPGSVWLRIVKGFGANALGQAINVASKIVLVPLFLRAWGVDIYGEWLLLSSFVAYLSLVDLGGQVYIVNRLTQAYACQDISQFRKILHSGLALFLTLPAAALVIFVVVISFYPPEIYLNIAKTSHPVVLVVSVMLATQFLISLPQGILVGVYRAVGLLPTGVMLGNLIIFSQFVLTGIGLLSQVGMIWIAVFQVLPYGIVAGIALADLHKRFPNFDVLSLRQSDLSTVLAFVRPSLNFLSIQFSQLFTIQGTVLIAGILLGSVQVVVYSALRTIAHAIKQLLSLITHTAWPELTRLDASNDTERLHRLFRFVLRTAMAGACVFFAIFHLWGEKIYHLWLGGSLEYSQNLMDLILVYVIQLAFWTACSHVLMATNMHRTLAKVMFVSSVFTLVVSYLGALYFGLVGLIGGMIVVDFMLPLWLVPLLLTRHQTVFSITFYAKELLPVAAAVLFIITFPEVWYVSVVAVIAWWTGSISDIKTV